MQATATRKYIRSSPRKMRRVVNAIRGLSVPKAIETLAFLPQAATRPIELTVRNAVRNLIDRHPDERFDETALVISEIRVDEGPRFKRMRAGARGRAKPYKKRLSHLKVVIRTVPNEGSAS